MSSFASSKILLATFFLLSFVYVLPLSAQNLQTEPNVGDPESAPISQATDDSALPKTADPIPPNLPERTLPAPPAVPIAPPGSTKPSKPSLAWRQKATRLSLDKFKSGNAATTSPFLRSFDSSYSDCLMALAASCASNGFKVEYINSNAGEILASSFEGQNRLVFVVWEQVDGKTYINAAIDRGNASSLSKSAGIILDTATGTISKRGRI